ncbi:hypothetical protein FB45DRAFT_1046700 [Roridomyces roridus]|uniref:Uncharacterized protein n=1 Tax=Roridomyces roridus TaxID=1738132 RepID=A0AAD7AXJ9_9AGAR|nr:hypothetical protein FB45DRAFT_1046700 [Roridomyces roridus]
MENLYAVVYSEILRFSHHPLTTLPTPLHPVPPPHTPLPRVTHSTPHALLGLPCVPGTLNSELSVPVRDPIRPHRPAADSGIPRRRVDGRVRWGRSGCWRNLEAREDIVVGWEWDDENVVHRAGEAARDPYAIPLAPTLSQR